MLQYHQRYARIVLYCILSCSLRLSFVDSPSGYIHPRVFAIIIKWLCGSMLKVDRRANVHDALSQAPNQPTGQVTPNPSSVAYKFL